MRPVAEAVAGSGFAAVTKAYRVYSAKVPLEGGGYTMDHSTPVYLFDAQGSLASIIGYGEAPEQAEGKIRELLRGA